MHARALVLTRLIVVVVTAAGAQSCVPPTPSYDGGPSGPRSAPIDFLRFVHDLPAVGGDWYDYDEDGGHVIAPLANAYLIRENTGPDARYAALRITSYYDPDTADSGRFTLAYRLHEGAWAPEQEWLTPKNVKEDGASCLDLFAKVERDCDSDLWQIQLRATRWLALEGPIVVARPSLQVRSAHGLAAAGDVHIATLEGRSSLSGLPDPASIPALDDGPHTSWSSIEWDRARYAPDLPEAGMAIGARFVDEGFGGRSDVWFLVNARRSLVRLVLEPTLDGDVDAGLRLRWSKVTVDVNDDTVPAELPVASESEVGMPVNGARSFLSFEADDLAVPSTVGLHDVPEENAWDLALVRADDGTVRLLVSPGAAVYNATQRDGARSFDDAALPERSGP